MNNLIIKRSQLIEAEVQSLAVGQKFQFKEIPNLSRNNIMLYGFEAYTRTQLRTSPQGNNTLLAADAHNVVVSFRDTNKVEFVYQVPLFNLVRSNVGGFITMITPRLINLTDSYIQLVNAGSVTAGEAVVLNLYYSLPGEDA
jgi:hypothetical protein